MQLRVKVQKNPFENYTVLLTGEGYQEDLTFDSLPSGGNGVDELRMQDCPVGQVGRSEDFVLKNHTSAKSFRFKWPAPGPNLSFKPAIGHLLPGASKTITVTFKAEAPVKLSPLDVKVNVAEIQYKPGQTPLDWDDTSTIMDYGEGSTGQPVPKQEPEPAVTDVAGTAKDKLLRVFSVADNAKYECDLKPILFRPTMMFQTRTFSFPLKNSSSSRLDYKFYVTSPDGQSADASGLYSVSPEGGAVDPGSSTSVTVKFSPSEVVDCERMLVCEIPNLDASCSPLVRPLVSHPDLIISKCLNMCFVAHSCG